MSLLEAISIFSSAISDIAPGMEHKELQNLFWLFAKSRPPYSGAWASPHSKTIIKAWYLKHYGEKHE